MSREDLDDFDNLPTPPLTPTKSELDTFQVLSNQNFVDFKKDKPNSKNLGGSPRHERQEKEEDEDYDYEMLNVPAQVQVPMFQHSPSKFQQTDLPLPLPRTPPKTDRDEREFDEFVDWGGQEKEFIPAPPTKQNEKDDDAKSYISKDSDVEQEIEYEKQALLEELRNLERQGEFKPVKELTMKDTLEEIQFQYDRVQNEISTSQGVQFAISGIKMGSSLLETVLKKFGFSLVDGFSNNLCKDTSKFNRPVTKLYKRYWRKGNMSPEAELSMIVLGSLAWTMLQNKMSGGGGSGNSSASHPQPILTPAPLPFVEKPAAAPPKVNLMQFSKEKEMEKKIEELQKKLSSSESNAQKYEEKYYEQKMAAEHALEEAARVLLEKEKESKNKKVVSLGSKTNSLSSNVSSLKRKTQPLKL
jgi:hypothetical protein